MAPKRPQHEDAKVICPPMPHAIKVLLEHDVLNGLGCYACVDGAVLYYKSQGLSESCVTKCAEYLLHTHEDERRKILDMLCAGGATVHNFAKLIAEYRNLQFDLQRQNTKRMKNGDTVVMDVNGCLH